DPGRADRPLRPAAAGRRDADRGGGAQADRRVAPRPVGLGQGEGADPAAAAGREDRRRPPDRDGLQPAGRELQPDGGPHPDRRGRPADALAGAADPRESVSMRVAMRSVSLLFLVLLISAACRQVEPPAPDLVARVGTEEIRYGRFEDYVKRTAGDGETVLAGDVLSQ